MSNDPTEPVRGPTSQNLHPVLVVQDAPPGVLTLHRFPLAGTVVSVGRAPGNQIVIPHNSVSREHARFDLRDGRWWVSSLQPSSNPVQLRGSPVYTQAPLASTDLISVGAVIFQFLEPQSQSLEDSLPYPLALAIRQVETAASSERRLKASMLGIELVFRFLFSAQCGHLTALGQGHQIHQALPPSLRGDSPVSMGMWVQLVCDLARVIPPEYGPLGVALGNLFRMAGSWGALQERINGLTSLRNNLMHRWFGEEDAYEAEAKYASSELREIVRALLPLRALQMVGWNPSDGVANNTGWPVRILQGASVLFPLQSRLLSAPLQPYWCYLVSDAALPMALYPCFALATSPQTRRQDLFVCRQLGPRRDGTMLVDGLTCGHELSVAAPAGAFSLVR